MPTLATPIAALILAFAAPQPDECNRGSMTPQTGGVEQLTRQTACWSPEDKVWFHNLGLDIARDSTVWILFAASGEASLLLADGGRVLASTDTKLEGSYVHPGTIELRLPRGRYTLQVRSRTAGTSYNVRPYWGAREDIAVAGCSRSLAVPLTVNRDSVVSVDPVRGCFDIDGRPAVIRRFRLDRAADVMVGARPRDGRGRTSVTLFGPGLKSAAEPPSTVSRAPGEPAMVSQHLAPGTYYAVFAAEAYSATFDVAINTAEPMVAARTRPPRPRACDTPAEAPGLTVGAAAVGGITVDGSCVIPGPANDGEGRAEYYRLNLPQNDTLDITLQGTTFSPVLALFRISDGAGLWQAADTTANGIRFATPVAAGEYLLLVSHARPFEMGTYRLLVARARSGAGSR